MPGDLTVIKPTEPVLTRKRQELTIQTASAALATADWYQLYFKVPQSGLDDAVFFKVPDANDQALFRIDELLNAQLGYQLPAFNADAVAIDTSVLKQLPTKVAERWFAGTEFSNEYTENIWALKAGLGHRMNQYDFHANFLTAGRFLAFTGRGQRVNRDTQLFLSWYHENSGSVAFQVRAMINFCNGASIEHVIETYENLSPAAPRQVFQIPAGFDQLGLDQVAPGEQPNCFSIKITDTEGAALSEVFSFSIEQMPSKMTFLFANSAGGWSTLSCFGHREEGIETDRELAEREIPANHAPSAAQYVAVPQAMRLPGRVEAGYLNERERLHFIELLRSTEVYEVATEGFLPVRITNTSGVLSNTFNPVMPSMIEYEYAFETSVYDNKVIW